MNTYYLSGLGELGRKKERQKERRSVSVVDNPLVMKVAGIKIPLIAIICIIAIVGLALAGSKE